MRLTTSWLLPAVITTASAASDASVYLFQADATFASNPPTLSPEQARLVFAQRLGVSKYHSLGNPSADTITYINKYGGQQESLFEIVGNKAAELVLIVEGVTSQTKEELLDAWSSSIPAFFISGSPSTAANSKLVEDVSKQTEQGKPCALEDDVNPFEERCWNRKSKIVHYNVAGSPTTNQDLVDKLKGIGKKLENLAQNGAMNTLVVLMVLMPDSSAQKEKSSPYGVYDLPSQVTIDRRQIEEPMNDPPEVSSPKEDKNVHTLSNSTFKPITGVPALCHATLDSCSETTNNCSGHGKCYKKRGTEGKDACFTCGCTAQNETFTHGENQTGVRLVYWGGAACQKEDVSVPFWLLTIFTVVLVGLVSWAIGLVYSIGEEKLPGVIGAGVSSNRAK